ncbi:MAG TPA: type II toxin-antitoxin system RelE/ParE family toxin [Rickettsia endosymbiont of Omalisus fontisbellaquei]|nr:type II toxin-antitoxin system RelE/ParE family toxin [Rickettsia endosymbiont of Omalisus fontisbellaquei]
MIISFACRDTEKLFEDKLVKCFHSISRQAQIKLAFLDAAGNINELRMPPGNRLELLTGDRKNQYSIRINDQWRICFTWHDENAHNVEIVDYH